MRAVGLSAASVLLCAQGVWASEAGCSPYTIDIQIKRAQLLYNNLGGVGPNSALTETTNALNAGGYNTLPSIPTANPEQMRLIGIGQMGSGTHIDATVVFTDGGLNTDTTNADPLQWTLTSDATYVPRDATNNGLNGDFLQINLDGGRYAKFTATFKKSCCDAAYCTSYYATYEGCAYPYMRATADGGDYTPYNGSTAWASKQAGTLEWNGICKGVDAYGGYDYVAQDPYYQSNEDAADKAVFYGCTQMDTDMSTDLPPPNEVAVSLYDMVSRPPRSPRGRVIPNPLAQSPLLPRPPWPRSLGRTATGARAKVPSTS